MSYICNDCGAVFQEPNKVIYGGNPWGQDFCPECGGTDFETAFYCSDCGTAIPEHQDLCHLCHECEVSAEERFQKYLDTFTDDELAYLTWKWEGRAFERSKV